MKNKAETDVPAMFSCFEAGGVQKQQEFTNFMTDFDNSFSQ